MVVFFVDGVFAAIVCLFNVVVLIDCAIMLIVLFSLMLWFSCDFGLLVLIAVWLFIHGSWFMLLVLVVCLLAPWVLVLMVVPFGLFVVVFA